MVLQCESFIKTSVIDMKISCEYLLRYYLKFLKYSGGFGESRLQKVLFSIILIFSCTGLLQLIPVLEAKTWNQALHDLAFPIEFFSTFIKALIYFKNRSMIFELIFAIDDVPELLVPNEVQNRIMKRSIKKFMNISKFYTGNALLGMFGMFMMTLIRKQFLLNSDFGVHQREYDNPWYWIVGVGLYLSMLIAAVMAVTIDALPAAVYSGIMMRVQVLQQYVGGIGDCKDFNSVLKEKIDKDRIKRCVMEYSKIWQLKKKAEKAFNGILLTQIILSFLIVSTALYQMSGVRFAHNFFNFSYYL